MDEELAKQKFDRPSGVRVECNYSVVLHGCFRHFLQICAQWLILRPYIKPISLRGVQNHLLVTLHWRRRSSRSTASRTRCPGMTHIWRWSCALTPRTRPSQSPSHPLCPPQTERNSKFQNQHQNQNQKDTQMYKDYQTIKDTLTITTEKIKEHLC